MHTKRTPTLCWPQLQLLSLPPVVLVVFLLLLVDTLRIGVNPLRAHASLVWLSSSVGVDELGCGVSAGSSCRTLGFAVASARADDTLILQPDVQAYECQLVTINVTLTICAASSRACVRYFTSHPSLADSSLVLGVFEHWARSNAGVQYGGVEANSTSEVVIDCEGVSSAAGFRYVGNADVLVFGIAIRNLPNYAPIVSTYATVPPQVQIEECSFDNTWTAILLSPPSDMEMQNEMAERHVNESIRPSADELLIGSPILIRGNVFQSVVKGIAVVMYSSVDGLSILIANNRFLDIPHHFNAAAVGLYISSPVATGVDIQVVHNDWFDLYVNAVELRFSGGVFQQSGVLIAGNYFFGVDGSRSLLGALPVDMIVAAAVDASTFTVRDNTVEMCSAGLLGTGLLSLQWGAELMNCNILVANNAFVNSSAFLQLLSVSVQGDCAGNSFQLLSNSFQACQTSAPTTGVGVWLGSSASSSDMVSDADSIASLVANNVVLISNMTVLQSIFSTMLQIRSVHSSNNTISVTSSSWLECSLDGIKGPLVGYGSAGGTSDHDEWLFADNLVQDNTGGEIMVEMQLGSHTQQFSAIVQGNVIRRNVLVNSVLAFTSADNLNHTNLTVIFADQQIESNTMLFQQAPMQDSRVLMVVTGPGACVYEKLQMRFERNVIVGQRQVTVPTVEMHCPTTAVAKRATCSVDAADDAGVQLDHEVVLALIGFQGLLIEPHLVLDSNRFEDNIVFSILGHLQLLLYNVDNRAISVRSHANVWSRNQGVSAVLVMFVNGTKIDPPSLNSSEPVQPPQHFVRFDSDTFEDNVCLNTGLADAQLTCSGAISVFNVPDSPLGGLSQWLHSSALILHNLTFRRNRMENPSANGAIFAASDGLLLIRHSRFEDNRINGTGGALYLAGGAEATLDSCTFKNNTATVRGGLLLSDAQGNLTIVNTQAALQSSVELDVRNGAFVSVDQSSLQCAPGQQWVDQSIPYRQYQDPRQSTLFHRSFVTIISTTFGCAPCPLSTYSLVGANLTYYLSGGAIHYSDGPTTTSSNVQHIDCHSCPFGADCSAGGNNVSARPNMFGVSLPTSSNESILMFRNVDAGITTPQFDATLVFYHCPPGFCCPSSVPSCAPYNFCQNGREGLLCGNCPAGSGEVLGSTKCRLRSACDNHSFWLLAGVLVLLYLAWLLRPRSGASDGFSGVIIYFYQTLPLLLVTDTSALVTTLASLAHLQAHDAYANDATAIPSRDDSHQSNSAHNGVCVVRGMSAAGKIAANLWLPAALGCALLTSYTLLYLWRRAAARVWPPGEQNRSGATPSLSDEVTDINMRELHLHTGSAAQAAADSGKTPSADEADTGMNMSMLSEPLIERGDKSSEHRRFDISLPSSSSVSHDSAKCESRIFAECMTVGAEGSAHSVSYSAGVVDWVSLSYSSVVQTCLALLYCVHLGPLGARFFANANISCWQWQWQLPALLLLLFVVPYPLLLYFFQTASLDTPPKSRSIAPAEGRCVVWIRSLQARVPPAVRQLVCAPYGDHAAYWESVNMGRRTVAALLFVLVPDSFSRVTAITVLQMALLLLHVTVRPFRIPLMNGLETGSLFLLMLVGLLNVRAGAFFSAGVSLSDNVTNSSSDSTTHTTNTINALILVLALIPLLPCAWYAFNWLRQRYSAWRHRRDEAEEGGAAA